MTDLERTGAIIALTEVSADFERTDPKMNEDPEHDRWESCRYAINKASVELEWENYSLVHQWLMYARYDLSYMLPAYRKDRELPKGKVYD